MEPQTSPHQLHWVNEAFGRRVVLKDGDREVGVLSRNWFSADVDAELNQTRLRFDVRGFLQRRVDLLDLNAGNRSLGTLTFGWGQRTATLTLATGEAYTWRRKSWLMREWSLVRDLPNTDQDPEVVHYTRFREFFTTEGSLELLENAPQADVLLLTGLFVWLYFRRQQAATTAATVAAVS
jgi:hypothetical protein